MCSNVDVQICLDLEMSPLDIILLWIVLVISMASAFPVPALIPWLNIPSHRHRHIMVHSDNVSQFNGSLPSNRIVRLHPPVERRQSSIGTILSEAVQGFGSATSSIAADHLSDEVTGDDEGHEEKEKDDDEKDD